MKKTIWILNGPNLNLLEKREPEVYENLSLQGIQEACKHICDEHKTELEFRQTNHEGVMVDWIQEAAEKADGLIINAAAFTHTSIAIHDALKLVKAPIIEVHLSNIYNRESFRHHSFISPVVKGVIAGLGGKGYTMAIRTIIELIRV